MSSRAGLSALVACLGFVLLAAPAGETAPAATSKSQWRVFSGVTADSGLPLLVPGWASNRLWVLAEKGGPQTLASARVVGGKLASFTATRYPEGLRGGTLGYTPIADGRLVFTQDSRLVTAPLLANGRLGAPEPIPDDLVARAKEAAPKLSSVSVDDGVRVGGRIVWSLNGGETVGLNAKKYQLVCCSESGGAVDLTRFIDQRTGVYFAQIGLDTHGRIWLAWFDPRSRHTGAVRGVPHLIELDRSSLAPRSNLAVPGVLADRLKLVCADSCRIVAQTARGDIVSWAAGERSATRIASHWERGKFGDEPAWLLDAAYQSGHLVVGYYGNLGPTPYADARAKNEVRVLRGDARGGQAKVLGTVPVTYGWPVGKLYPPFGDDVVDGAFVPGGFVALEHFQTGPASSPVVYAFVRLGR